MRIKTGLIVLMGFFCVTLSLNAQTAFSQEMSDRQILEQLNNMKVKINELETEIKEVGTEEPSPKGDTLHRGSIGVKGLADRVRRIEEEMAKGMRGKWAEKLSLSGLIEVAAGYEETDHADPVVQDTETSDIALATVEVGIDVDIAEHVTGHVLFLWEENDTEPVDIDEGFIIIDGGEALPLYLNAGKLYVPFGSFESHFISDPLTLQLGETRESALKGGFAHKWVELCVSAFNGDINETGDDARINGYAGSARVTLPEETISGLGLVAGVSYISNIADSDSLQEVGTGVAASTVTNTVGGFSVFLSASFIDKVFVELEYLAATDEFGAGELTFDSGKSYEPKAWNAEVAYQLTNEFEVAVKYEGGHDLGDFLPEKQYGAVVTYGIFENTSLAFEYLHGKFENNDEREQFTAQLGIEF